MRAQPEHVAKGYCPRPAGVRMPATYINHYAANGGVVVPQFGGWAEETDRCEGAQHACLEPVESSY
jgi:agmatine/peptidylarginine deiminase